MNSFCKKKKNKSAVNDISFSFITLVYNPDVHNAYMITK